MKLPSVKVAVEFRREQYGWTQAKMALKLGMQKSHYSEFIKGKRKLPFSAIKKAYKLGVPAQVLLK
jgi:transcriptional regulator with XRE-family HTH domain